MANRFPLTINTTNSTIEELPSGTNLDLSGSNISNVVNVSASGNISGSYILGNGSQLTGITTSPSGANTQLQFNDAGSFGGSANLTFDKTTNTLSITNTSVGTENVGNIIVATSANLGAVSNVTITGGSNGQVLITNGSGGLSFSTVSATSYTLQPCKVASVNNRALSGLGTLDDYTLLEGDRVLLVAQSSAINNGVYIASSGTWVRASDFTTGTAIGGILVPVTNGTYNGDTLWQCTNSGNITVGTDSILFARQGIKQAIAMGSTYSLLPNNISSTGIAVGPNAYISSDNSISFGLNANVTATYAIAMGVNSNVPTLGSIAIGTSAKAVGTRSIVLGEAQNPSGDNTVTIGYLANTSNSQSISIGTSAGNSAQQGNAIAIGYNAGKSTQNNYAIAIGSQAGNVTQGAYAIAMGFNTGNNTQGTQAIAIGRGAGAVTQQANSVAIGVFAGAQNIGVHSIAIGANAGFTNQANNSIILNATGANLDQTTANTFTVKPVRANTTANVLYYNTSTGEISYGGTPAAAAGGSNTYIQYNDGGSLNGIATFTYDKSAGTVILNATTFAANLAASTLVVNNYIETVSGTSFMSGTLSVPLNNYTVQNWTIDGNTVISAFTNLPVNGRCRLMITTSASTAYTIAWPSDAKFSGGAKTIATGSAGLTSIIDIFYNGTYYYCDMHAGYV